MTLKFSIVFINDAGDALVELGPTVDTGNRNGLHLSNSLLRTVEFPILKLTIFSLLNC